MGIDPLDRLFGVGLAGFCLYWSPRPNMNGGLEVMSEDFKLKSVFLVAGIIGAVVLLASIVGVIVNIQ